MARRKSARAKWAIEKAEIRAFRRTARSSACRAGEEVASPMGRDPLETAPRTEGERDWIPGWPIKEHA